MKGGTDKLSEQASQAAGSCQSGQAALTREWKAATICGRSVIFMRLATM